jgi:hypothetical protein
MQENQDRWMALGQCEETAWKTTKIFLKALCSSQTTLPPYFLKQHQIRTWNILVCVTILIMQSASSNHQNTANISQKNTSSPWKVWLEMSTQFNLEVKPSEGSIVEIWNSNIVPYHMTQCPRILGWS